MLTDKFLKFNIIQNINDCGCLAIKFTQWILPKIELIYDLDPKKDKWFGFEL